MKPQRSGPWRQSERDFWRHAAAGWWRWEPVHLYGLSSVDPALLRALELGPGQRVLDVGCGLGEPALTLARWVAPKGSVLGIDLSSPMLRLARLRMRERGIRNARFRTADVESFRWKGRPFDRVVSRYGLPFVQDIEVALRRLYACLVGGGKLAAAVWGPARRNQGFLVRERAARPFVPKPAPDPATVPHPLRFANPAPLVRSMRKAGFAKVRVAGVRVITVHQSPESFAQATLDTSHSELFERLSARDRARLRQRLVRGARAHLVGGSVRLRGFAWVISATRTRSRWKSKRAPL